MSIGLVLYDNFSNNQKVFSVLNYNNKNQTIDNDVIDVKKTLPKKVIVKKPVIIDDVPFTSQAPLGNWNDFMNQEGCEEASIIMAVYWFKGLNLTAKKADSEIKDISNYELKIFGSYINTSIYDTAKILQKYYTFSKYNVVDNISKEDMIDSLSNGKILLIPAYGRGLHNKFYTSPGPVSHMLVVIGYDPIKKEFITNDPGTKSGKGYRYNEDILYSAIWNYPTSTHNLLPPSSTDIIKKSMIEIYK
ncbi:MAG: C39 family peptidase [Candidatus Gracilibacteria bacterium]|nr:C39 family peptidase [Candidatus Gracilibacteria bacterium]